MEPIAMMNIIGICIGGVVAIISSFSACFLKSRCTHIQTPCMACDRDVLSADSDVYKETNEPVNPMPFPIPPKPVTAIR